jgi:hypothetical protein
MPSAIAETSNAVDPTPERSHRTTVRSTRRQPGAGGTSEELHVRAADREVVDVYFDHCGSNTGTDLGSVVDEELALFDRDELLATTTMGSVAADGQRIPPSLIRRKGSNSDGSEAMKVSLSMIRDPAASRGRSAGLGPGRQLPIRPPSAAWR